MSLPGASPGPFQVVRNPLGRTSVWPTSRTLPTGWTPVEIFGTRQQCLNAISQSSEVADHRLPQRRMSFSLMFFGDQEFDGTGDKYRLLRETAKRADRNGFDAIWLPERHFTQFGCLYPSPAVLHAALARETSRISLRAGSVVMPLHHPVRVAEDWAVVDNLSNGRVELAFASGWHPNDFALAPDQYAERNEQMQSGLRQVRQLWRGEAINLRNGTGQTVPVRIYPTPIQPELKVWLTIAGSRGSFVQAGRDGFDVLTHLFNQDVEQLAENILLYRQTRQQHGWPEGSGRVAVALHTFVAQTVDQVIQHAKEPYCEYLRTNLGLLKNLAISRGSEAELEGLSATELDQMLSWAFDKFVGGRSLMGTPQTCQQLIHELLRIGVTEVACLLDFGPPTDTILEHFGQLETLVQQAGQRRPTQRDSML